MPPTGPSNAMSHWIVKPIILVASIFVMAIVYDLMWTARPDYFRVQSGVNFLPLDLVQIARDYSAYSDAKPLPEMTGAPEEEAAVKQIEDIYKKFQLASVALSGKKIGIFKKTTARYRRL
jgi:hypothetical protein